MLVVRRIEVADVSGEDPGGLCGIEPVRLALSARGPIQKARQPQLEVLVSARGPLLEVGHLHAGGGVHPIGGLHQRRQQDRLQLRRRAEALDLLADGIDPLAVLRLKEAALSAEGLGEVAGSARERVERIDDARGLLRPVRQIGLDVAGRQGGGVGVEIIGANLEALLLEPVPHPRGSREQVHHRPAGLESADHLYNQRNQDTL